jgi:hypothetical protein
MRLFRHPAKRGGWEVVFRAIPTKDGMTIRVTVDSKGRGVNSHDFEPVVKDWLREHAPEASASITLDYWDTPEAHIFFAHKKDALAFMNAFGLKES